MELIRAKEAYAYTLMSQVNAQRDLFKKFTLIFNKTVTKKCSNGEASLVLRWKDFDLNETLAVEEELLDEVLSYIVLAGYEVEFCYNSPSAYNPCGVVVAWGTNACDSITQQFNELSGELYRGE